MESFSFLTDAHRLSRTVSLDLSAGIESGRISVDDTVRITYNSDADLLTGVVVKNGSQFGHVFEPTSFEANPSFVQEMDSMKEQD